MDDVSRSPAGPDDPRPAGEVSAEPSGVPGDTVKPTTTVLRPVAYQRQEFPAPIFPGAAPVDVEPAPDESPVAVRVDDGRGRRGVIIAVAAVAVVVLSVGAFWLFAVRADGNSDREVAHGPLSAAEMTDFVRGHYALLPGGIDQTWQNLSPVVQQGVGGYSEYAKFWSTVRSVQLVAPRPRDSTSVSYTLVVNFKNGDVGTEERWAEVRRHDDRPVLYGITTVTQRLDRCAC